MGLDRGDLHRAFRRHDSLAPEQSDLVRPFADATPEGSVERAALPAGSAKGRYGALYGMM